MRDGKKATRVVPNGIRRVLLFCIMLLGSLAVTQAEPIGAEFLGKWSFDHALAQEKSNSQKNYVTRTVSLEEFRLKVHLLDVPTGVDFLDEFVANISHPSWSFPVVAVMNEGKLEFRNFRENPEEDYDKKPDLSEIDSYPAIQPVYDLALNDTLMSMKSSYTYTKNGETVEGILTVFYRK